MRRHFSETISARFVTILMILSSESLNFSFSFALFRATVTASFAIVGCKIKFLCSVESEDVGDSIMVPVGCISHRYAKSFYCHLVLEVSYP